MVILKIPKWVGLGTLCFQFDLSYLIYTLGTCSKNANSLDGSLKSSVTIPILKTEESIVRKGREGIEV